MALYAWRIYNQRMRGKKLAWDADGLPLTREAVNAEASAASAATPAVATSERVRSLLSAILYSPACKKAMEDYINAHLKKQRKQSSRSRKLDKIADAAQKRKEKEQKAREKADAKAKTAKKPESEKQDEPTAKRAKTDAPPNGSAAPASDSATAAASASVDETSRDAKRAEKALARKEKQAAKKAAPSSVDAATTAAKQVDSDASASSSDDSGDETGAPKSSSTARPKPSRIFGGLTPGKIIDGIITGVESFGLFVEFFYKGKERKGMIHVSMLSDSYVNIQKTYGRGDRIQAIVTKLDEKTGRISLGAKASLFPADKPPRPLQKLSQTAVDPSTTSHKDESKETTKMESMFMDSLHAPKASTDSAEPKLSNIKKFLSQVAASSGAQKQTTGVGGKNRLGQRERRKLIASVLGDEAEKKPEGKDGHGHEQLWKKRQREHQALARGESSAASSSSDPPTTASSLLKSAPAAENRRTKRLKMHADALAQGKEINPLAAELVKKVAAGELPRGPKPPKTSSGTDRPATAAAVQPARPNAANARPASAAGSSSARDRAPHARPSSSAAPKPAPARAAAAPAAAATPAEELHPSWHAKQLQAAKAAAAPQGKKITFD
jgi:predicted RNA-binding protein with RPS1 domain